VFIAAQSTPVIER
jgi:ADP-dependent phosphofructokinase/glucokinase